MKLRTYLNFSGNCREALEFYEKNLGGKIGTMMTWEQIPGNANTDPAMKGKIMHARITIGGAELMASDGPPSRVQPMRSVYLALNVESDQEAERIYALLSPDGEIFMPIQETFFASRFAQLRDKFGTSWMVLHERSQQSN